MENIKCYFCKKEMKNNYCESCETMLFIIKNDNCKTFNSLLDYTYKMITTNSKINKEVLSLGLQLNNVELKNKRNSNIEQKKMFSDIHIIFNNGRYFYFIKKSFNLTNNYKDTYQYIFANYVLTNKELEVIKGTDICLPTIIDRSKELTMFIEIDFIFEELFALFINFNEKYLTPYDINLLDNNEKKELIKQIKIQESEFFGQSKIKENERYHYVLKNINTNNDLNVVLKSIDILINSNYDWYKNRMDLFKEKNKIIFERALIKKQVNDF